MGELMAARRAGEQELSAKRGQVTLPLTLTPSPYPYPYP